jgi:hypothetical protein
MHHQVVSPKIIADTREASDHRTVSGLRTKHRTQVPLQLTHAESLQDALFRFYGLVAHQ